MPDTLLTINGGDGYICYCKECEKEAKIYIKKTLKWESIRVYYLVYRSFPHKLVCFLCKKNIPNISSLLSPASFSDRTLKILKILNKRGIYFENKNNN